MPTTIKIPCEECITYAICMNPEVFARIYVDCECPILEEYIDLLECHYNTIGDVNEHIDNWFKEATGKELMR